MNAKKQATAQQIVELQRKLLEALAGQVHTYHFASEGLRKANTTALAGSGVVLMITALGGREIVGPTLIRGGLSDETIAALRKDLKRSYYDAIAFVPKES